MRHRRSDPWRDISLALLLAGILGNLTDRLLYGHVIDFLLFNLHIRYADPWPAFNVADSCISIAVVLFIIHSFRKQREAQGSGIAALRRPDIARDVPTVDCASHSEAATVVV